MKRRLWPAAGFFLLGCSGLIYHPTKTTGPAPEKGSVERISLAASSTQGPRDLFITSPSGHRLHARLYPSSRPSHVLFVYFHGNSGNLDRRQNDFRWMADSGFHYLIWDYGGFGRSSGKPSPEALARDARSLFRFCDSAFSAYDKVYLGTSLGGAVLLGALGQEQAANPRNRLFIADCAFDSYRNLAASYFMRSLVGAPLAFLPYLLLSDAHAPIRNRESLRGIPLLVTHCRDDRTIPLRFGRDLFERIPSDSKEFWALENCGHSRGFSLPHPANRARLVRAIRLAAGQDTTRHGASPDTPPGNDLLPGRT